MASPGNAFECFMELWHVGQRGISAVFRQRMIIRCKLQSCSFRPDLSTPFLGKGDKEALDRGLQVEEVAVRIGVAPSMVTLWEMNRSQPMVSKLPAIIRFLGFVPYKPPSTFGEWLKLVRRTLGYSQRHLASLIAGDQRSIKEWETDYRQPTRRSIEKLEAVLHSCHSPIAEGVHEIN